MKKSMTTWIAAAFLMAGVAGHAQQDEWNLSVTPYGWMAGLDGDLSAGNVTAPIDLSASDVLEDLDFTAMFALDGNNGRWGAQADVFYVNLDDRRNTAAGTFRGDVEQWIVSLTPYLRVKSDDTMTWDVGAGGRYIDTDVDLHTPAGERSQSRNWIDPVVMTRVRVPVAERCYLNLTGDIGGFGIESDFTWQLTLTAGYALTDNTEFLAGYRHLDVDYKNGGFGYDVATSGFGLGFRISL